MKPSPLASILLFVAAAALLYSAVSTDWYSSHYGEFSSSIGLIRGRLCHADGCDNVTIFTGGGGLGAIRIMQVLLALLVVGTAGLAIPTGIQLFKPGRRVLAIVTLAVAGFAVLLLVTELVLWGFGGASFGIGFYAFVTGALAAITGGLLGTLRPGRTQPVARLPMPGPPCPQCSASTQWMPQYNRWLCPRCQRYL